MDGYGFGGWKERYNNFLSKTKVKEYIHNSKIDQIRPPPLPEAGRAKSFSPVKNNNNKNMTTSTSSPVVNATAQNFTSSPPETLALRPGRGGGGGGERRKGAHPSRRKVSVGGYSRTYSEKRYQINRTRHHEKHSNRTIKTETKISFHRTTPGEDSGPIGVHKISVLNETFSYPGGKNVSSEFKNVTYFDGETDGDRGEDNVHPLTHVTNKLYGLFKTGEGKGMSGG